MPTRTHQGPQGEIQLFYENEESASGHREITRQAKLIPGPNNEDAILLVVESTDQNFIAQTCDGRPEYYRISVSELVSLIKEHGKKTSSPRPPAVPR